MLYFSVLIFQTGCEKNMKTTELTENTFTLRELNETYFAPELLLNEDNPFDIYGLNQENLYIELFEFIDNGGDFGSLDSLIEAIMTNNEDYLYPEVDTCDYSVNENAFLTDLFSNATIDNLISLSKTTEDRIKNTNNLTAYQKNRLFSLVSQFKFNLYYGATVVSELAEGDLQTWEEDLDNCINDELGNIFNDNNPVDDIGFVVGIPGTWFAHLAYCVYEATFCS